MNIGWGLSLGALNSAGIDSSDRARYSRLSTSCRIRSFPSVAIRSSKGAGKKQGVSETRNPIGTPHRSASSARSCEYFSGSNFELNDCRSEGIMQNVFVEIETLILEDRKPKTRRRISTPLSKTYRLA